MRGLYAQHQQQLDQSRDYRRDYRGYYSRSPYLPSRRELNGDASSYDQDKMRSINTAMENAPAIVSIHFL